MRMAAEAPTLRALAAGLAVMSLAGGTPAAAGPTRAVPSAATFRAMREEIGREGGVRVIGTFGQREIPHAVLDSTGVRSTDWEAEAAARTALFETKDVPRPVPDPITWSQIEEVKTNHQHKLRGALVGAGLGLAVCLAAIGASSQDEVLGGQGLIVSSVVLGAALGTFVGSLTGSKTIYRAQEID